LRGEKGQPAFTCSYEAVKRFVRRLKVRQPTRVWRMECQPGEEAQVDFGRTRTIRREDGKLTYANVLRVTLSFSRKGYSETVPAQSTECFLRALENAFRHFGGVPATLCLDNLKAAVTKADWYDPALNPKIVAFGEHYGVAILPTRPYTPQHKGKVESDVGYLKSSALKGREFTSLASQNEHLNAWESTVADRRIHGTTRKQVASHFEQAEKPALRPLPSDLFPCYQEGARQVHRDSYVEVKRAYYQVPPEYIGQRVWVRWDSTMVRVFDRQMKLIVSHVRLEPGRFSECLGVRGLRREEPHHTSLYWIERAALIGTSAQKWATAVVRNRPERCIRVLQGLMSLREGPHRSCDIDRACQMALAVSDYTLRGVRQNLAAIELTPGASTPIQEQLPFLEEHPIIRPLSQYQELLSGIL